MAPWDLQRIAAAIKDRSLLAQLIRQGQHGAVQHPPALLNRPSLRGAGLQLFKLGGEQLQLGPQISQTLNSGICFQARAVLNTSQMSPTAGR
jgi:hypothetical protein